MTQFWGANVDELKGLGVELTNRSGDIKNILGQLNGKLNSTNWQGPDADRFRSAWTSQHVPALNRVISELNQAGVDAKKNAEQQRSTSA
jgi:uncharacterized protein YukE